LEFTSLGGDLFATSTKFFAIGDLPFVFRNNTIATELLSTQSAETDFPNGYAGIVPSPFVPVFPPAERTAFFPELNTTVPLFAQTLVGVPWGNWTADGTTFLITGPVDYTIAIPTLYTYSAGGQMYNFWIASDIVTYTLKFSGSLTYYSDT
jgi:hypothetical protein